MFCKQFGSLRYVTVSVQVAYFQHTETKCFLRKSWLFHNSVLVEHNSFVLFFLLAFYFQIITEKGIKPPIVVVGNKVDTCERQVEHEVTEMVVCEDWQCGYVECSAKENRGILEIFKELLVQANIRYNLSPAVRRRRQSLPSFSTGGKGSKSPSYRSGLKRHSCTMT